MKGEGGVRVIPYQESKILRRILCLNADCDMNEARNQVRMLSEYEHLVANLICLSNAECISGKDGGVLGGRRASSLSF